MFLQKDVDMQWIYYSPQVWLDLDYDFHLTGLQQKLEMYVPF